MTPSERDRSRENGCTSGYTIYSKIPKESDKLCLLVVMGVNHRGEKKILVIEDGFRESAESWKEILRDSQRTRVDGSPSGDRRRGSGVFGAALREIFPAIRNSAAGSTKL